jgi:NitT/TauT family transport system ATP-binding protein
VPSNPRPIISFAAGACFGAETIFEALRFDVMRGEFLCILGPSGCGKSTALRLIGGLLPASAGGVAVAGEPAARAWSHLAYVFQAPRLVPWRNARDNVALAIELRRPDVPKRERRARAQALLDRVGLGADAEKFPRMLSGGERQRVSIARALAVEPEIVLMDEPFSALDVSTRQRLRQELVELWRQTGKTIVFVTHDIDEALALADRILVFSRKPAQVIANLTVAAERPRRIEATPTLMEQRDYLHTLFQRDEMEPNDIRETLQ